MARIVNKINEHWEFEKQGKRTDISLPHTWNAEDGQTGQNCIFVVYARIAKS